jgi:hypothetical protein
MFTEGTLIENRDGLLVDILVMRYTEASEREAVEEKRC